MGLGAAVSGPLPPTSVTSSSAFNCGLRVLFKIAHGRCPRLSSLSTLPAFSVLTSVFSLKGTGGRVAEQGAEPSPAVGMAAHGAASHPGKLFRFHSSLVPADFGPLGFGFAFCLGRKFLESFS